MRALAEPFTVAAPVTPADATSTLSLMFGDEQGSATVMMQVTLDALGAMLPASLTDSVTRNAYTPYGAVRGLGTSAENDQFSISKRWLNQVSDEASTGLVYLNARYYDPVVARFVSPDPLMNPANPSTLDPYRYAGNNPVMFTDATGLFDCPWWMPQGVCDGYNDAAAASNKAAANAASAAAIAGAASAGASTSSKPAEPSVSQAISDATDGGACGSPGWYYPCGMRPTDLSDLITFQQQVNRAEEVHYREWWQDHADEVLLVLGIVVGAACVTASIFFDFGTTVGACFAVGSAINGISVADNISNRGMSVGDAVTLGVANEALLGMGFGASTALARVPFAAGTPATQRALNAAVPYVLFETPADALNVGASVSGWPMGVSTPPAGPPAILPPLPPAWGWQPAPAWGWQQAPAVSSDGYSCPKAG
jgi:RHS repeat-associated protein